VRGAAGRRPAVLPELRAEGRTRARRPARRAAGPHPAVDVVVPPAPGVAPARACGRRSAAPRSPRCSPSACSTGALLWSGGEERPIVVNVPARRGAARQRQRARRRRVAVAAEFTSDWPGDDGWTIQLEALPKGRHRPRRCRRGEVRGHRQGRRRRRRAGLRRLPEPGPGEFVVYSGVYDTKKAARKDLKALRKDFPDAKVVEVAASAAAARRRRSTRTPRRRRTPTSRSCRTPRATTSSRSPRSSRTRWSPAAPRPRPTTRSRAAAKAAGR
jgi:hypothetical protein